MKIELTERRKADRIEMARQLVALAGSFGAATTSGPWPGDENGKAIEVRVTAAHGLSLNLVLQGKSKYNRNPDVICCSWHFNCCGDIRLSPQFASSVNPYHGRKATWFCHGFDDLKEYLEEKLEMARNGTAFTHPNPNTTP